MSAYFRVVLAEEITPYYVDNNILVKSNGSDLVFAYATPYSDFFPFSTGDLLSAICDANVSPTGGANPVKVLQILENSLTTIFSGGKLIWVYQNSSPGDSFTFPGVVASVDIDYIFLASSTSNGTGWYFLNLFNIDSDSAPNNYTIEQVYIDGYTNVYPSLPPNNTIAIPNPNGDIITASTVDVYVSTPDPSGLDSMTLYLSYQADGYLEQGVYVYGTGWYSIPLSRNVNTSQGGINIQLANLT